MLAVTGDDVINCPSIVKPHWAHMTTFALTSLEAKSAKSITVLEGKYLIPVEKVRLCAGRGRT
jgi:hypothetical protein